MWVSSLAGSPTMCTPTSVLSGTRNTSLPSPSGKPEIRAFALVPNDERPVSLVEPAGSRLLLGEPDPRGLRDREDVRRVEAVRHLLEVDPERMTDGDTRLLHRDRRE